MSTKEKNYIVLSDYYSRFLEILHLSSTTAEQVVAKLKATFARFGIPEVVVSDNGPQFTSETFQSFSREYDFEHVTSSPHHPSSNGHAERAVQSAKAILRQKDPVLALLSYRTTPNASTGVSPAELLMGRRLRNTLPTLDRNLIPKWPDQRLIRRRDDAAKQQHAFYFNRRHGVRNLPPLRPGDPVLVKLDEEKRWKTPAMVMGQSATERSYMISSPEGGRKRRNRCHLQLQCPSESSADAEITGNSEKKGDDDTVRTNDSLLTQTNEGMRVTRSGRVSKPVQKLNL